MKKFQLNEPSDPRRIFTMVKNIVWMLTQCRKIKVEYVEFIEDYDLLRVNPQLAILPVNLSVLQNPRCTYQEWLDTFAEASFQKALFLSQFSNPNQPHTQSPCSRYQILFDRKIMDRIAHENNSFQQWSNYRSSLPPEAVDEIAKADEAIKIVGQGLQNLKNEINYFLPKFSRKNYSFLIPGAQYPKKDHAVIFLEDSKGNSGPRVNDQINRLMTNEGTGRIIDVNHLFVIYNGDINSSNYLNAFEKIKPNNTFEHFNDSNFSFNLLSHCLCPISYKHVPKSEVETWSKEQGVIPFQLSLMLTSGIVSRFYGAEKGSCFQLETTSPIVNKEVCYTLVVPGNINSTSNTKSKKANEKIII